MKERKNKSPLSRNEKPENYAINAKICRLVEAYPCMYNRAHASYQKKDVLDKAWEKIASEMNDSVPSCKERWRNIRTSFARSININKVPTSANRTKPYYLHNELKFLAKHITPGIPVARRIQNLDNVENDEDVSMGEDAFHGFVFALQEPGPETTTQSLDGTMQAPSDTEAPFNNGNGEATVADEPDAMEEATRTSVVQPANPPRVAQEHFTELTDKRDHFSLGCNDPDVTFMQVVVDDIKQMTFRQKIEFKKRVYEVINEIYKSSSTDIPAHNTMINNRIDNMPKETPATAVHTAICNNAGKKLVHDTPPALPTNTICRIPTNSPAVKTNVQGVSANSDNMPSTSRSNTQLGVRTRSYANPMQLTIPNINAVIASPRNMRVMRTRGAHSLSADVLKEEVDSE